MTVGASWRGARTWLAVGLAIWATSSLATTYAAEPESPAGRLGVRTAPLVLVSRPDVRADLGLSAEQVASAEHTLKALQARARELKGKKGKDIVTARRAIDEAQERWMETELTPDQRARLSQIDLQWEGPSALASRPLVAEALALTAEQRTSVNRALAEHYRKRAEGHAAANEEHLLAREVLAILTPEQQTRWKALLGKPFVPQVAQSRQTSPPR